MKYYPQKVSLRVLEQKNDRIMRLENAILLEMGRLQDNYGTHWAGCDASHPRCAALKRLALALSDMAAK